MKRAGNITLSITSGLEHVWALGVTLKALCQHSGIPEYEASLMELAVVEAVNNCIEHAYENQPGRPVEVAIEIHENEAHFAISDQGKRLEALPEATLEFNPREVDNLPEGGMGLYIINQVMDRVEYSYANGKNQLGLTKYFTRD
jgi:serine/threonine-protein kinase RsbW